MSVTSQNFYSHLKKLHPAERYLIAYSGGVDSHVLLHLCAHLSRFMTPSFSPSFSAVYIDHGLSTESKLWGQHCQDICIDLNIHLIIIKVDAQKKVGQSPEATARTARYQAFSQILQHDECLLVAQHIDDQAETLLLQLLRGSGTKGLSAMPRMKSFAKGVICRPLLEYHQQDIIDYAQQHQLQWVEDESNQQQCFDRNYLRHTIMPLLAERWPKVRNNFSRSASLLAESQQLLDEMAISDLSSLWVLDNQGYRQTNKLVLSSLLPLLPNKARLNNILRYWIAFNNQLMPSKKILEQIVNNLLQAGQDATPLVSWRNEGGFCEIRRYQNQVYLLERSSHQLNDDYHNHHLTLLEHQNIGLPDGKSAIRLTDDKIMMSSKNTFERDQLLSHPLSLRFRQGGERFRRNLSPQSQSHSLKHWFQQQQIPSWERAQIPLIFWGDELIQIGDQRVNNLLSEDSTYLPKNLNKHRINDEKSNRLLMIQWYSIENK
jgi:tRNA(Ile)-lysidine synthase